MMADLETVERRLTQIEQKLDRLTSQSPFIASETAAPALKSGRSRSGRIFLGVLIIIISLVWLGQSLGFEWLADLKILPLVLIAFGIYLILGGREG